MNESQQKELNRLRENIRFNQSEVKVNSGKIHALEAKNRELLNEVKADKYHAMLLEHGLKHNEIVTIEATCTKGWKNQIIEHKLTGVVTEYTSRNIANIDGGGERPWGNLLTKQGKLSAWEWDRGLYSIRSWKVTGTGEIFEGPKEETTP